MSFLSQIEKKTPSLLGPKLTKELVFSNLDQNLNKWNISQINPTKVYNRRLFDFKQSYIIKTYENSIRLSETNESITLLTNKIIDEIKNEFNYIHIGLVQIANKPLTKEGLNSSLLACLNDECHNKFQDFLLGIIESSLCTGLVYFNYLLSLHDLHANEALTLNLQTQGYDIFCEVMKICVVYRICLKAMTTIYPNTRIIYARGKTTFFFGRCS